MAFHLAFVIYAGTMIVINTYLYSKKSEREREKIYHFREYKVVPGKAMGRVYRMRHALQQETAPAQHHTSYTTSSHKVRLYYYIVFVKNSMK